METSRKMHRISLREGLWEEVEGQVGARKVSEFIERLIDAELEPGRTKRRLEELDARLREVEGSDA